MEKVTFSVARLLGCLVAWVHVCLSRSSGDDDIEMLILVAGLVARLHDSQPADLDLDMMVNSGPSIC